MPESIKNVILIGGSGNIGTPILSALIASSKFKVSVLSRLESKSIFPTDITVFKSDYSTKSLVEAFQGQDAVICALGHDAWGGLINIVDSAVTAGVKRFIPSEFGSNTLNKKAVELFGTTLEAKVKVVNYLKEQEAKGLSWTGIATGPFFDWGLPMGLFGFNIKTHSATIYDGGNKHFSATNLSQVANAVVGVLLKPEETANQFLFVDSFTVTQNEILAALETATQKKWEVTNSTLKSAEKIGKEGLAKGDFHLGMMNLLHVVFFGEGFGSDFGKDEVLANEKLGLPKQTLEDTVRGLAELKPVGV